VSNTDKEYCELIRNGLLGDLGGVVKNRVILDQFHKAVKNSWRDTELLLKQLRMVFSIVD
jgi:hypothetical protein